MENFSYNKYLIRRKVFRVFGKDFYIYNEKNELQFFIKQKSFKLKEDIRVFSSLDMSEELLLISARKVIDFSSAYDVVDSKTGEKLGSLKRKGMKSILKDEWVIQNPADEVIGKIKEKGTFLALTRRFLINLIPQTFNGTIDKNPIFIFKQKFNPFIQKIVLDYSPDKTNILDRRMGIAAAVLICSIEGRQN